MICGNQLKDVSSTVYHVPRANFAILYISTFIAVRATTCMGRGRRFFTETEIPNQTNRNSWGFFFSVFGDQLSFYFWLVWCSVVGSVFAYRKLNKSFKPICNQQPNRIAEAPSYSQLPMLPIVATSQRPNFGPRPNTVGVGNPKAHCLSFLPFLILSYLQPGEHTSTSTHPVRDTHPLILRAMSR